MRSVDARTGLVRMDRAECLELLAAHRFGRLALAAGGTPMIFPVNYRMDGEALIFRSADGSKVDQGRGGPACFEIDAVDDETRSGWSVVVSGLLEEITTLQPSIYKRTVSTDVDPWAEGEKPHWLRLRAGNVTGRRVGPQSQGS
jgi:nitroimidazol reductase NimA-like FMN-containing flavoprotein (pyridoxamine 5'-phosphate oxidase superfamily)